MKSPFFLDFSFFGFARPDRVGDATLIPDLLIWRPRDWFGGPFSSQSIPSPGAKKSLIASPTLRILKPQLRSWRSRKRWQRWDRTKSSFPPPPPFLLLFILLGSRDLLQHGSATWPRFWTPKSLGFPPNQSLVQKPRKSLVMSPTPKIQNWSRDPIIKQANDVTKILDS